MSPRYLLSLLLITGLMVGCNNSSVSSFGSTVIANGAITVKHDMPDRSMLQAPAGIAVKPAETSRRDARVQAVRNDGPEGHR